MSRLDRLYVVDLDRCLLNIDALLEYIEKVLRQCGLESTSIVSAMKAAASRDSSLDGWKYLAKVLKENNFPEYEFKTVLFKTVPDKQLLYVGAKELLSELRGKSVILTFGGETWQNMKYQLAGLEEYCPIIVTDTPNKAQFINERRKADGYDFSDCGLPVVSDQITLIDDKVVAFEGLAEDCDGYLVLHGYQFAETDRLPSGVAVVDTLTELEEMIK